jgi:CBS domain-containing protein
MTRPAVIFRQDMVLGAAVKAMRTRKIRHAPVVNDKGGLVGIVSDRDLRQAVLEPALAEEMEALSRTLRTRTLKEVMTWGVTTVKPETEIREAARLMHTNKIGALPVIQNGKVAGMLSSTGRAEDADPDPGRGRGLQAGTLGLGGLIGVVVRPEEASMNVRDVMTKDPFTIDPEAPLATAIDMMRAKELRHLPVVDEAGQLVGIITDRDLRHAAFGPAVSEYLSARAQRRLRGSARRWRLSRSGT